MLTTTIHEYESHYQFIGVLGVSLKCPAILIAQFSDLTHLAVSLGRKSKREEQKQGNNRRALSTY